MSIWEATTNLENSAGKDVSFQSGTTGYTTGGTNTIAASTEQAKFGTQSGKVTYQNNALLLDAALTLTAAAHSTSRWLYIPTAYDGQGIRVQFSGFTGATGTLTADANMALRDQWQRVSVPNVVLVSGDLAGSVQVINTGTAPTAGRFIYIDGCQTEAKRIATPFTLASRSNSRAQVSASVLDELQGWVALRIRPGWSTAGEPGGGSGFPVFFQWSDDGSNQILCFYVEANNQIQMSRETGNVGSSAAAAVAVSLNTPFTLIGTWTPTQVAISINGAAFTQVSNTNIPTLAATLFDIGSTAGIGNFFDGDMLWVATGKGTLSDANAAAIHGTGNTDPTPSLFPSITRLSGIWTADTSAMTIYR